MFRNTHKILPSLAFLATCFALGVMSLGAYTRLMDAGLGCPDWPGCYGHYVVPATTQIIIKQKAWIEMIHRYAAGTLASLTILIAIGLLIRSFKKADLKAFGLATLLITLIIYQALLGKWTVTLKLVPFIVTQHLLGGVLLLSLFWFIYLYTNNQIFFSASENLKIFRKWTGLGWLLLLCQMALGAWTSTHYAALVCPDFPVCSADHAMQWNWHEAFSLITPIGPNYQGGLLSLSGKATIHMLHRWGALCVSLYLLIMMLTLFLHLKTSKHLQKIIFVTVAVLFLQIILGISNVLLQLPVLIAVLHNVTAGILLLCLTTLNYAVFTSSKELSHE